MKPYKNFFKRAIDITASAGVLLVLSVPLAAITAWLHFANKGAGAFFFQERPGKDGKIFRICKFKSMNDERGADGELLPDEVRLTKPGKFVRATSLDELPQLWNVLKGDMSLIGPRPLLPRYLPWYTEREAHRHDVRPGITGLAQVNGRNNLTWEEKLEFDAQYVESISFINDCRIVLATIRNVIHRSDIQIIPTGEYLDVERKKRMDDALSIQQDKTDRNND
ncbi:MAG: sugar transferase [Muribaculaceae bacterium]|nr:sugar transferase [Muribaculaceae bacterium]